MAPASGGGGQQRRPLVGSLQHPLSPHFLPISPCLSLPTPLVGSGRRIHAPWPRIRCSGVRIHVLLLQIRRPPPLWRSLKTKWTAAVRARGSGLPALPLPGPPARCGRARLVMAAAQAAPRWLDPAPPRPVLPSLTLPLPRCLGAAAGVAVAPAPAPSLHSPSPPADPSSPTSTRTTLNIRGRIGASWVSICLLLIGPQRGGGLWATLTPSGWSCSVAGHTVRLLACWQWGSVPFTFVQGPTAARLRGLVTGLLAAGLRVRGRLPAFSSGRHNAVWSPRRRRPRQPRG